MGSQGGQVSDEVTQAAIERARAGGPDAFAELFARHDADVLSVCRRMLGGLDAAEDARSEVFLRARRAFADFERGRPFRPWLLTITGHCCIDQLRRRATERRLFSEPGPDEEALPAAGPSPLSRVVAMRESAALGRAIEQLPLRYRLPLLLRYFADEDYASIAEVLGVSRNQVGSLLFRAKRMLRAALASGDAAPAEEEGG